MSLQEESSHRLVEIQRNDWKILLELYAENKTDSTGYRTIQNYMRWIEKNSELDIKFFSLDGDWKTDGTFIIIVSRH